MRMVIRGHPRSSEVIRGHTRSSEVIRGHPRPSEVIRGHQRSSEVIRGHQYTSCLRGVPVVAKRIWARVRGEGRDGAAAG